MPTNPPGYMKKYARAHPEKWNNPKERKKRAKRNAARRMMEKKGLAHKGDNLDVDHRKPLRQGGSNKLSNLRMLTRAKNRADNAKGRKHRKK